MFKTNKLRFMVLFFYFMHHPHMYNIFKPKMQLQQVSILNTFQNFLIITPKKRCNLLVYIIMGF